MGRRTGKGKKSQKDKRRTIESNLQKLETKRWELMLAAERKCGPAPMKGKKWYSPQLKEAAKQLCIAKCWVRKCFTMEAKKGELEEAQKSREDAMINLQKVQKNARQYRDEMLDKLAEKREDDSTDSSKDAERGRKE